MKSFKTTNFDGITLFQHDIELNFGEMVQIPKGQPINVLVVGAWRGDEIRAFLRWENPTTVYAFEPNPETFDYLQKSFSGENRVHCFKVAAGDKNGTAILHSHNTASGTDSLLPAQVGGGLTTVSSVEVPLRSLDDMPELATAPIDLFWIDVQGFELSVFKGATRILQSVKGIYVELNYSEALYQGAVHYDELDTFLRAQGFKVAHIELAPDPERNGGVALYVRDSTPLEYFTEAAIKSRLAELEKSVNNKTRLTSSFLYQWGGRLLPVSLKARLKRWLP